MLAHLRESSGLAYLRLNAISLESIQVAILNIVYENVYSFVSLYVLESIEKD